MKNLKKFVTVGMLIFLAGIIVFSSMSVQAKKKSVQISDERLYMDVGDTMKIRLYNNTKKVKWSTSNKKIISLSAKTQKSVKLKAKKSGKATVTAKVGKKKYTCKIRVYKEEDDNYEDEDQDSTPTATATPVPTNQYSVTITSDLPIDACYDNVQFTIKNNGTQTIYLGNWSDVETRCIYAKNILAGSQIYQSNENGYFALDAIKVKSGESKTTSCARLYFSSVLYTYYKTFHLSSASCFDFFIYTVDSDGNLVEHKETVYASE